MHWIRRAILATALAGATALQATAQPASPAPSGRFIVVLDAAHGGADTGARLASGQAEKSATLALSVRLRSLLSARNIAVVTTRESDATLDANRRATVTNHAAAQACLSLHASESGSGVHLFVSSLAPAPATNFPAWKTAQAAWVTRSIALAGALNSALLHAGINVTLERTTLSAVDSMICPAVAVEIAPARSPDGKVTAEPDDAAYQARVAAALVAALADFRTEARQP